MSNEHRQFMIDRLKSNFKSQNFTPKSIYTSMKKEMFTEFIGFIQKFGVIGLAIGVVIGQAVNQLVNSLVTNLVTPLISLILNFALQGQQLRDYKFFGIGIGAFFDDLIKFILVIFIIYIAIRYFAIHFLNDDEKEKLNIPKKEKIVAEIKAEVKAEIKADIATELNLKK